MHRRESKNPREELDMAEVHDCFTITELAIYENFGSAEEGKAKGGYRLGLL